MFNISRYLDNIFTIGNPEFEKHFPDKYPAGLQLNKANTSDKDSYQQEEFEFHTFNSPGLVGLLVVLRINVDLAIFQPYLDLEAGDNQWFCSPVSYKSG